MDFPLDKIGLHLEVDPEEVRRLGRKAFRKLCYWVKGSTSAKQIQYKFPRNYSKE